MLRPLSVYEYRLAAEAGRRAVFVKITGNSLAAPASISTLSSGWPPAIRQWRLIAVYYGRG